MSEMLAQVSVKAVLPVQGENAAWMVYYGDQGRYGLSGGRVEEEDGCDLRVALDREVGEEIGARLVRESARVIDTWCDPSDERTGWLPRLVVVYAADLLAPPPYGRVSDKNEWAVKVPLAEINQVNLDPRYKIAVRRVMHGR